MRSLENAADRDRELLPALWAFALVKAGTRCLAFELGYFQIAAMWAIRAMRPADFFEMVSGLIFRQIHEILDCHASIMAYQVWFVKCILPVYVWLHYCARRADCDHGAGTGVAATTPVTTGPAALQ